MRVAVEKDKQQLRWRALLTGGLLFVFAGVLTLSVYLWLDAFARDRIVAMGGAVTPGHGVYQNLKRVWREAPAKRGDATGTEGLPLLRINLKRKAIGHLAMKRQKALKEGILVQEPGDYVNAEIRVQDGDSRYAVRAEMRLKGDFLEHIMGEKWSFRVRTKGDDQVLGMRVFSIQHPKVRGYVHEALIHEHMRREGVLAPRYTFVHVIINDKDKGIMALEEHFAKELLESQERRESVIVRFDEDLKWRSVVLMGHQVDFSAPYPLVTPFQSGKVAKMPNLTRDLDAAVGLMRGFLSKDLAPSDVFDPDLTARFLAVAEIWGAEHSLAWNNMRFYYNPITGKLEPIAFDANLQDYTWRLFPTLLVSASRMADPITADWLEDPKIRTPFLAHLKRIAGGFAKQSDWQPINERQRELLKILRAEFPLIADIDFFWYWRRALRLLVIDDVNFRALPVLPPNYPILLHAFLQKSRTGLYLDLYNLVPYPVEISQLSLAPKGVTSMAQLPLVLPPTLDKSAPTPTRVKIISAEPPETVTVGVQAEIRGYEKTRKVHVAQRYSPIRRQPVLPSATWTTVLAQQKKGLRRDGDVAHFGPGRVVIDKPLILPDGVDAVVAPGTELRFGTRGLLLVRGTLDMPGEPSKPIRLLPKNASWCGIAVLGAGGTSEWSHVEVRGTSGLALGSWLPTGSVMFHESPVRMRNCSFAENSAEDALNLFRTTFDLQSVSVSGCDSDAIDMDFCEGKVRGGRIEDVAGDGIDVSGSKIDVEGTAFYKVRDKALSAGERSEMDVRKVTVEECGTGLASKDASKATIDDATFKAIKFVAVIAFTKKPEYGPARITGNRLQHDGSASGFRAQLESSVVIDGKAVPPEPIDVDALYRDGPMNKHHTKPGNKPGDKPGNKPTK